VSALPGRLRSLWWAIGWFGVALTIYLSLMPNPPGIDVPQGDKLGHLAVYATLMLWFAQLVTRAGERCVAALALLALGVALEFAQRATGYREFSYADMLADAVGIALGSLLAPPRLPNLLVRTQRLLARALRAS